MRVLGIESSCDETALAVYDSEQGLMADVLYSQVAKHAEYGGVVPELASRDHVRKIAPLFESLAKDLNAPLDSLDAIAYTRGPGLLGALMVGYNFAAGLSLALDKPLIGIHHLEGHLLSPFLDEQKPTLPFLALLVSGGHTQIIHVKNIGNYELLGETIDDAAGEAFDKTAKLLGLPYPGGPHLEKLATHGDKKSVPLTGPMLNRPGLEMSFSGLKTQVAVAYQQSEKSDVDKANLAASFQETALETLLKKCERAIKQTGTKTLVIAGGVSANQVLREKTANLCEKIPGLDCYFPPLKYCTDNAAMIAYAGYRRLEADLPYYQQGVTARWPLDQINQVNT